MQRNPKNSIDALVLKRCDEQVRTFHELSPGKLETGLGAAANHLMKSIGRRYVAAHGA
jgi:hypothetical protein